MYITTYDVNIHTYMYIHCTYIHTYVRTCTHIHTYIHNVHTYVRTYIHVHVHTYVHTYICTYVHTHTYIVYIHTCTHAHVHVHIYIVSMSHKREHSTGLTPSCGVASRYTHCIIQQNAARRVCKTDSHLPYI